MYISKEVGCRTLIRNPPLTRNCNWEDSANRTLVPNFSSKTRPLRNREGRQENSP